MASNYWNRVLAGRLSRRRALATTGGATAAAAFLAACGGDDDGDGEDVSGLVTSLSEDNDVKRGGTLKSNIIFEARNFDPQNFPNNFQSRETFGLLTGIEYEVGDLPGSLTTTPNIAESWEYSPDRTTLTMKISPEAHFAPLPPVNGRSVDAQDIVYSWQRIEANGNQATDFSYNKSPSAPIVSMQATDNRTVVIRVNQPNAGLLALLGRDTPGSFYIVPKEDADKNVLDVNRTPIGSGFFYMSDYQPSVGLTLKRNPAFRNYKGDLPYVDTVEMPLITETSVGLSQLLAGNLHFYAVPAEEIIATKQREAQLELKQTDFQTSTLRLGFGTDQGSVFADERVRQAWVLSIDREQYIDTQYNVSKFQAEGLPVTSAIESGLQANIPPKDWFVNGISESEKFGQNAKFFKQDVAEARKLLQAAGLQVPVATPLTWVQRSSAWAQGHWYNGVDIVLGMLNDSGLWRPDQRLIQNFYAEYVVPYHHQAAGRGYVGAAFSISNLPAEPSVYLFQYYNEGGGLRQSTDAKLTELTGKAVTEFDEKRRRELVHEIQVYEAGRNFFPRMGAATSLSLNWPAVRNYGVFQGGTGLSGTGGGIHAKWFIDPTKPPLGSG
jgi:ABC-type transport system substrate-binding protein